MQKITIHSLVFFHYQSAAELMSQTNRILKNKSLSSHYAAYAFWEPFLELDSKLTHPTLLAV